MGHLCQKTILITGGSSGIGLATARTLAEAGARVVINGRSADALSRVLAERPASVSASRVAPLAQVTSADFDQVCNVNVRGAFFCVQKAQPLLRAGGSVVLIGSGATELGRVGRGLYAVSKVAVRQVGRSLAAELTLQGLRVNVVSPGPILAPFNIPAGKTAEQEAAVDGGWVQLHDVPQGPAS